MQVLVIAKNGIVGHYYYDDEAMRRDKRILIIIKWSIKLSSWRGEYPPAPL